MSTIERLKTINLVPARYLGLADQLNDAPGVIMLPLFPEPDVLERRVLRRTVRRRSRTPTPEPEEPRLLRRRPLQEIAPEDVPVPVQPLYITPAREALLLARCFLNANRWWSDQVEDAIRTLVTYPEGLPWRAFVNWAPVAFNARLDEYRGFLQHLMNFGNLPLDCRHRALALFTRIARVRPLNMDRIRTAAALMLRPEELEELAEGRLSPLEAMRL